MYTKLDPYWEKCVFILKVLRYKTLKVEEVTLRNEELHNLHSSQNNYDLEAKRNETRRVARIGR